jgi:hypothetical protein
MTADNDIKREPMSGEDHAVVYEAWRILCRSAHHAAATAVDKALKVDLERFRHAIEG